KAVRRVCGAHYTTLRRPRNRPAPLNFHDAAARRRASKLLPRRVGARPGRLLLVGNRRAGLAFSLDAIPPLGQQWSRLRRLPVRRGRQKQEAADVEREREERDVARRGRERLCVVGRSRAAFEREAREPLEPTASGRVERCEQHVLDDERRAEERREAAQKPARVERGELVLPERPQEEEGEHPTQKPRVRQNGVETLGRREEERRECERV